MPRALRELREPCCLGGQDSRGGLGSVDTLGSPGSLGSLRSVGSLGGLESLGASLDSLGGL